MTDIALVRVFVSAAGNGGNPAPIVLDADAMDSESMREVAARYGHESGFVLAAEQDSDARFRMRYFVPRHEMEMCGHATVGALWLLHRRGRWGGEPVAIDTLSGRVLGERRASAGEQPVVEISQPPGRIAPIGDAALCEAIDAVLRIAPAERSALPVLNAATSRVKTLVPLRSVARLDALAPDFARMQALCERIGSTGLYPFAIDPDDARCVHARQFPKSSGYPEDAATGIAASALLFGLREYGLIALDTLGIRVLQGRAMGAPSEIRVRFEIDPGASQARGCRVGGRVALERELRL